MPTDGHHRPPDEYSSLTLDIAPGIALDILWTPSGLSRTTFASAPHTPFPNDAEIPPFVTRTLTLLKKYSEGIPVSFADIPLDHAPATAFQRAVWRACSGIPCGQTHSYGWLARQIGRPTAARAVGNALGRNPLPIVIPCHRVISSDGTIGGFGSGIHIKRRLIALEKSHPPTSKGSYPPKPTRQKPL